MSLKITILEFSQEDSNNSSNTSSTPKMKVKSKDVYSKTPMSNGPFFTFHQQFDYVVRSSNHKFKSDVSTVSLTPPKQNKRNRPLSSKKLIEKPCKMRQCHASMISPLPNVSIPSLVCNSPSSPSITSDTSSSINSLSNTNLSNSQTKRYRTSISIRELLN